MDTNIVFATLAAMAPPEVPAWFRHNPKPMPEHPKIPAVLSPENRQIIEEWMRDTASYDLPEELMFFQNQVLEHNKKVWEHGREEAANRLKQWMEFWAKSAFSAGLKAATTPG